MHGSLSSNPYFSRKYNPNKYWNNNHRKYGVLHPVGNHPPQHPAKNQLHFSFLPEVLHSHNSNQAFLIQKYQYNHSLKQRCPYPRLLPTLSSVLLLHLYFSIQCFPVRLFHCHREDTVVHIHPYFHVPLNKPLPPDEFHLLFYLQN